MVERRVKNGRLDRGDITGIPNVVIECKAERVIDIPGYLGELELEMENDGAAFGFVFIKNRRHGTEDGYAVCSIKHARNIIVNMLLKGLLLSIGCPRPDVAYLARHACRRALALPVQLRCLRRSRVRAASGWLDRPVSRRARPFGPNPDGPPLEGFESVGREWPGTCSNARSPDCIIILPGWERSTGCHYELSVCHALGKPVFQYPEMTPVELPGVVTDPVRIQADKDGQVLPTSPSTPRSRPTPVCAVWTGLAA